MQLEVNKINTWISPKIAKKEKDINTDKYQQSQCVSEDKEAQKVSSSLALASLCGVKKNTTFIQSPVSEKANEMISPTMKAGQKGNVTSIFYINDVHGRLSNMEKITTASEQFDSIMPSYVDKLKFSAGDIMLGSNIKVNKAANSFLNSNNFMATVVGNHEVDQNMSSFLKSTQDAVYKIMGSNAEIDKSHKLYNRIIDSYVQDDENGNKYGIIALMPFDLSLRTLNQDMFDGLKIEQKEETKKYLQTEVDRFSEQGINRIIVLSHTGYENDVDIAKSVKGIDIILGGHSHDLVEDLSVGGNLLISKEDGSPTVVTQAGRDGNHYGILNVEWDENGEIIKAENIVRSTASLKRNEKMNAQFNEILGTPNNIGTIGKADPAPKNNLKEENPHAAFLADVMKQKYGTDIGIVHAGTIRSAFESGTITDRDMNEIFPFRDKPAVITLTEKELVEAMKHSASSIGQGDGKPGLVQVSGMRYSVSTTGELVNLFITDKNGNEQLIDINEPNENKTYTATVPEFLAQGLDGYTMLNKVNDKDTKIFETSTRDIAIEYLSNSTEPVNIQKDGRVQIV